jgi:hypothetical protein
LGVVIHALQPRAENLGGFPKAVVLLGVKEKKFSMNPAKSALAFRPSDCSRSRTQRWNSVPMRSKSWGTAPCLRSHKRVEGELGWVAARRSPFKRYVGKLIEAERKKAAKR